MLKTIAEPHLKNCHFLSHSSLADIFLFLTSFLFFLFSPFTTSLSLDTKYQLNLLDFANLWNWVPSHRTTLSCILTLQFDGCSCTFTFFFFFEKRSRLCPTIEIQMLRSSRVLGLSEEASVLSRMPGYLKTISFIGCAKEVKQRLLFYLLS